MLLTQPEREQLSFPFVRGREHLSRALMAIKKVTLLGFIHDNDSSYLHKHFGHRTIPPTSTQAGEVHQSQTQGCSETMFKEAPL